MDIHIGKKYAITTDGITAHKSDGRDTRHMKYYAERDLAAIAGEIDELTAWQILHDIAAQIPESETPVSPEHILIDGNSFVLAEWSRSRDARYEAPEGYDAVWALAATVFYAFMGCCVFQGLGGKGQSPTAPIPTLRRNLPELSSLIVRCLDYTPASRPTLDRIIEVAQENIERCQSQCEKFPPVKDKDSKAITADEIDAYWPEQMC